MNIKERLGPAGEREAGIAVETGAVWKWPTGKGARGQEEAWTAQVRSQLM